MNKDAAHFVELDNLTQHHIALLLCDPKLIDFAKGTAQQIRKRLVKGCKDEKCIDAMAKAFNWLLETDHITAKEIKTKKGKNKIKTDEQTFKLKWSLAKDKAPTTPLGNCHVCNKYKSIIGGPDNQPTCAECMDEIERALGDDDEFEQSI